MSVLTIRAHRRYAVRLPVELRKPGCKPAQGLLIEVSVQGARISNLGRRVYQEGDAVTLEMADGKQLAGTVRWAHDGLAGIRLVPSLPLAEISKLLDASRELIEEPEARYGT